MINKIVKYYNKKKSLTNIFLSILIIESILITNIDKNENAATLSYRFIESDDFVTINLKSINELVKIQGKLKQNFSRDFDGWKAIIHDQYEPRLYSYNSSFIQKSIQSNSILIADQNISRSPPHFSA